MAMATATAPGTSSRSLGSSGIHAPQIGMEEVNLNSQSEGWSGMMAYQGEDYL
jgi:hypothetical protein